MDIDPFDTILYQSPRVTVSRFCAHPTEPRFHDSGPARFDCFVFPISGVRIQHTGGEPLLTSPNVVMFYNRGQTYVRDRLGPAGDICDWFSIFSGSPRGRAMRAPICCNVSWCGISGKRRRWTRCSSRKPRCA